jgi:hypothetical protein
MRTHLRVTLKRCVLQFAGEISGCVRPPRPIDAQRRGAFIAGYST